MAKWARALATMLLGAYLVTPNTGLSQKHREHFSLDSSTKNFSENYDKVIVNGKLHPDKDVLELEVLTKRYNDSRKTPHHISHADLYLIHPQNVRVDISNVEERGYLVPQNRLVNLKDYEGRKS